MVLQQLDCKSLVYSHFFPSKILCRCFRKFSSASNWWKHCKRLVLSYSLWPTTMFLLIIFPQKGSWFAFFVIHRQKTPLLFPAGLWIRTTEQRLAAVDCGCLSGGLTNPPDATDTEDNGCACVVGAFLLWLTATDLAAAFNGVRVACWLYFIAEHRPHRHNKLWQGDLCKSEISSSKANMPDILRRPCPILQSPQRKSKQSTLESFHKPPFALFAIEILLN